MYTISFPPIPSSKIADRTKSMEASSNDYNE